MFLSIASRIFAARAVAAAFSVAASWVGLRLLSSEEYATSSVAIASSAVLLPIFFQPFAKFVLVSGEWQRVGRVFWLLQPAFVALILGGSAAVAALGLSTGVAVSAAVLAISQGWKEFCGELARSMGDVKKMSKLYVLDAATTTVATAISLSIWPKAETLLLSSAVSSAFWSTRYTPFKSFQLKGPLRFSELVPIYRYSIGISVATFINSSMLTIGRAAIKSASSAELMGAIQFLLDILQKSVALIASSLLSAVIPEARRAPLATMVRPLLILMVIALAALAVLSFGMTLFPLLDRSLANVSFPIAACCATYVWANRYKGVMLDMPLIASKQHSAYVIPGAVMGICSVLFLAQLKLEVVHFMLAGSTAILLSGSIGALLAKRLGLLDSRHTFMIAVIPFVVAALTALILLR